MDKSLRERAADLVARAAVRSVAQWLPAEKRTAPLTGMPEFLAWIKAAEKDIRSYREPDAETVATRSWLALARHVVELSDLAQEVRSGKRPSTEFGQATYIEGALQRVIFASLRGYLSAKLGLLPLPSAIEKLVQAKARLEELLEQHATRGKERNHPTVTQEVAQRTKAAFEMALKDLG